MFAGRKVGIILTGGNIDTRLLANVLLRDLARSGRLARLRFTLQDRPGSLFNVMREFEVHQVNIIEISHQRIFTHLPAKGLITDIECEARDREQIERTGRRHCAPRATTVSHVETRLSCTPTGRSIRRGLPELEPGLRSKGACRRESRTLSPRAYDALPK